MYTVPIIHSPQEGLFSKQIVDLFDGGGGGRKACQVLQI